MSAFVHPPGKSSHCSIRSPFLRPGLWTIRTSTRVHPKIPPIVHTNSRLPEGGGEAGVPAHGSEADPQKRMRTDVRFLAVDGINLTAVGFNVVGALHLYVRESVAGSKRISKIPVGVSQPCCLPLTPAMETRASYTGLSRKLVVALDIGTTYSGAAYALLDPGKVPQIKSVTRQVSTPYFGPVTNGDE